MKKVKLSVEYQLRTDDDAQSSENTAPMDESDHQKEVEEQPEDVGEEDVADPAEEEEEKPATKEDEATPAASEEAAKTEVTEDNHDNDEFIVISQEEAPIELAEKYPVIEVYSKFIRLIIDF